jgi:Na+/H+-dicarboxylate symporter
VSLSKQIGIALVLGLGAGLTFGERLSFLEVGADAFVQLLQMTVLPYVTVSLVAGLGKLSFEDLGKLAVRGALLIGLIWGLTFLTILGTTFAFPEWETASFFSTSLRTPPVDVDFLALYIPSNFFGSLAGNVVPAVVLFCLVMGVALIGIQNKQHLLDWLDTLTALFARMTNAIVKLTPLGIFCIMGHAAGTMGLEELTRLQVYVVVYTAVACAMGFWLLPALVPCLTPLGYRQVFGPLKDALVTAFMTGNLFIVLPSLTEKCKEVLESLPNGRDAARMTEVVVPASFNFPSAGKLLTLVFVLFAGWFTNSPVEPSDFAAFSAAGLVSHFGSTTVAVPFLLDMFRIPADMFQMFMAMTVLNSRFATLVGAMHTVVVAILLSCATSGHLRIHKARLVRYAIVSAVLLIVTIGGTRVLFQYATAHDYTMDKVLGSMALTTEVPAEVLDEMPPPPERPDAPGTKLAGITRRGVLRVGFYDGSIPYAFRNTRGDLVGLDIELAHHLATELGLTLQFVPVRPEEVAAVLSRDVVDVVMSGLVITTERAATMRFTTPTLDETIAFLVADHRRGEFGSLTELRARRGLRIGCFPAAYYRSKLERVLPDAEIVTVSEIDGLVQSVKSGDLDAVLFTAERGSALSLLHPQLTVAVPESEVLDVPLAFGVAMNQPESADFLDTWIGLKQRDRTLDRLYDYWILGRNVEPRPPRWNLLTDVFDWDD